MRCPECGGTLKETGYEVVCQACGLITEDSPTEHQGEINRPAQPAVATAGTFQYDGRIVKTAWLFTTKQKNLQAAKTQISLVTGKLKLPDRITTESFLLFSQAAEKGLNRGRDNQSLIYASVYAACLVQDIPKTPLEITAYSSVSKTKMLRAYRLLTRGLGLRLSPIKPVDLVQRFGSRLELKPETISRAAEIVEQQKGRGQRPETIVAAALYIAAKENGEQRTQRQVANTTGVIEVTIRKQSKELLDER